MAQAMTDVPPTMANMLEKIASKEATVGVMGLGYVGLPLAATFHKAGFNVRGFDTNPEKVEACQKGISYLDHLHDSQGLFRRMADSSSFMATTDMTRLAECDAILICVPTPLTSHFEPDLSFVKKCASLIAASLKKGQLIVLESTTYPGTTRLVIHEPALTSHNMLCVEYPAHDHELRESYNLRVFKDTMHHTLTLAFLFCRECILPLLQETGMSLAASDFFLGSFPFHFA